MKSTLKHVLLSTISVVALAGAAHAADPAPAGVVSNILDGAAPGSVTVAGITVYGTFDVGVAYLSHAAGQNTLGGNYIGQPYVLQSNSRRDRFTYQNNALSQSAIGVKGNQALNSLLGSDALKGWSVGFDAAINFDPLYGDIADICKSVVRNNGVSAGSGNQVFAADGSRCGQLFGGDSWVSLKNDVLGELRFGRQLTLLGTTLGSYDPATGYAFSLFSFSGTVGAGGGATEESRWNNALKYTNTIGPVRVGAAYRFEGGGQGGDGWSVQAGVDLPGALKGLSVDGVYAKENSAITIASFSSTGSLAPCGGSVAACDSSNIVSGTIQDTETWAIASKYKFSDDSVLKGATLFGGYEHITRSNPSSNTLDNHNTIGGYQLGSLNFNGFVTDRDFDVVWAGGKYQFTPKLLGSVAWYRQQQNNFASGVAGSVQTAVGATRCNGLSGRNANGNCSGALDFYSVSFDYQLTKRLDLYAGASWTDVSNGASASFLATNEYNLVSGVRFRF